MQNLFKIIILNLFIFTSVFFSLNSQNVLAAVNCDRDAWQRIQAGEAPAPNTILCPIVRIFNVFVLIVGIAFIAMIAYGALKGGLAFGDVKGVIGAKNTWTYAFFGLLVVVGFYAGYVILATIFGITPLTPERLLGRMNASIESILNTAWIGVNR
jgi:hypothetical protein